MSDRPASSDIIALTRQMLAGAAPEAWLECLAPDVHWESVGLGTSFDGREQVRGFLDTWAGRYEDYEVEALEVTDLGGGVVFAVSAHSGRPAGSRDGMRLPAEVLTHSFVWDRGAITQVVSGGDTPQARAAAESLARELLA